MLGPAWTAHADLPSLSYGHLVPAELVSQIARCASLDGVRKTLGSETPLRQVPDAPIGRSGAYGCGWVLRRTGETLRHPARRRRGPQRALPKDEPFHTQRRITSDGDQTAPGIPKARAASTSPAAVHALSNRALWPGCARARRRARDGVACPWAPGRARRHRTLPDSLAVVRALRRCKRRRRQNRLVERTLCRMHNSGFALNQGIAVRGALGSETPLRQVPDAPIGRSGAYGCGSPLRPGRLELGSRGAPRRGDRLAPLRATSAARIWWPPLSDTSSLRAERSDGRLSGRPVSTPRMRSRRIGGFGQSPHVDRGHIPRTPLANPSRRWRAAQRQE